MKKITKTILFIVIMFVYCNLSYSQDMITMKTGEDINAKVLEVTTSEIKYKKTDMLDGPIYSVLKTDVLIIRYNNGTKDVFDKQLKIKNNQSEVKKDASKETKTITKQSVTSKKSIFGIKGGLNISSQENTLLSGITSTKSSSLLGFHIGGFFEHKISEKFSIQPELLFSTQGGKLSYNEDFLTPANPLDPSIRDIEIKSSLYYINVPITFKYYLIDKFTIEFGPQVGFLVSSNIKNSSTVLIYKNDYKSLDYGLNFGAGYVVTNNISIGIRYNMGLNNISNSSTEIKNNVFSLSTLYKL